MARTPNAFVDPRTSNRYEWPLNHAPDGAEETGLTRTIEHSATTSGTGVVRQQGALAPQVLIRRGTILDPAQHDKMVAWAKLGQAQTIYYEDATGSSYEVLITSFRSREVGVLRNTRGGATAPLHIWKYTLEMEVIDVLTGTWDSTAT